MFERSTSWHIVQGGLAGQRGPRWRGAARATVGVVVQAILAGVLLLAGGAWANATSHSHHAATTNHRMVANP